MSSKLKLSFYQGYIIRMLSACWVSVSRKSNICWCMSIFQMVH
ncbi:hypothetical protein CsSME_00028252 [Camellia sinensis var. sinensis]